MNNLVYYLTLFLFIFFSCSGGNSETLPEIPKDEENDSENVENSLSEHDKAVLVDKTWIRDPYIVLHEDKYYLTGTTRTDLGSWNRESGSPVHQQIGDEVILYESSNLTDWTLSGTIIKRGGDEPDPVWAPEIHWIKDKWVTVFCPSYCSELYINSSSNIKGSWNKASDIFQGKHDPSIFIDDDKMYLIHGYKNIQEISSDFSSLGKNVVIEPSDRKMGHEGCFILKIGTKYVLFGTAWSTDVLRKGSYNLYYCTADNVTGPYSERRFAGRFLGHGTMFKDKEGKWWCTAFYNADSPALPINGIQNTDLSKSAQTINQMGTTLVPMEVLFDGDDVFICAKDDAYRVPGPDEVQKFELYNGKFYR